MRTCGVDMTVLNWGYGSLALEQKVTVVKPCVAWSLVSNLAKPPGPWMWEKETKKFPELGGR